MDEKHIPKVNNLVQYCWYCQGVTEHKWTESYYDASRATIKDDKNGMINSICTICLHISIWIDFWYIKSDGRGGARHVSDWKRVYPLQSDVPKKNRDMPKEIESLYDEAASVLPLSPKSAAALLRLALQKLMVHLGEPGDNINTDIGSLVEKGLPKMIQEAMDTLRIIGNDAVHPGQINLDDNTELATKLFGIINLIIDQMISKPKEISSLYNSLPSEKTDGVKNRDTKKTKKK